MSDTTTTHAAPFEAARGKLGFGCMRLPVNEDKSVDIATFSKMVDAFIDGGLNYFDIARPYHSGNSEPAVAAALASRHDRDEFLLADKLSPGNFERREDIRPLIEDQLRACGVDHFDFYLMHSQGMGNYEKYQRCGAYDEAFAARDAGLVRHVGFSFHSNAAFLDRILTDHPDVEFVQLQVNYLDWENGVIQSRECCEVAAAHGKPVIVMEPVKGGRLVNLPDEARDVLAAAGPGSPASYALRFAAGLPGVEMVLSGMGTPEMIAENVSTFSPLVPLSPPSARPSPASRRSCAARTQSSAPPAATAWTAAPRRSTSPTSSPASTPSAPTARTRPASTTRRSTPVTGTDWPRSASAAAPASAPARSTCPSASSCARWRRSSRPRSKRRVSPFLPACHVPVPREYVTRSRGIR